MKRVAPLLLLAVLAAACVPAAFIPPATPTPTAEVFPTVAMSPAPNFANSEVHMFDAQRGWGWSQDSGGNSRLMITQDGGVTWVDRSPHSYAYGRQGAWFLDPDHAWLPTFDTAANKAGLVRTSDGGETWSEATGANGPYSSYKFQTPNDGIADTADVGAGNAYVRFFATHDGGMTWGVVPLTPPRPEPSLPEGTLHICNICGDTASLFLPNRLIITHGDLAGDPQGAVRLTVSMELGKTWTDLKLPMPSPTYAGAAVAPDAPVFFDDQHGVLPVHIFKTQDGTNYAYRVLALYLTSDGGRTWTTGPNAAQDVVTYESALDVLSMTDAVVRCGSSLCVTSDAGQTWSTVKPDIDFGQFGGERQLIQIDFVDLKTGWAVIDDDDVYQLYKTTDGGATWDLLSK